ncbi:MAG: SCP2 sterol-binding domain-containing protein, partial [Calditrichaeota bacterium]|nr:SCP2 sterol-binding domain-containing protein [Calditrichota bacterium]
MGYLVFSDEWNRAFADQINQNEAYRKAAADWEWPLVLMLEPENTGVWLDLYRGKCRSARAISAADWEVADYAISTNLAQWQQILSGERDPIMALMRGKLNLRRGKLLKLARYGSAAKQLVASAAKIPTVFPGEATGNSIEILSPKSVANQNVKIYVTTSPAGLDQDSFPMKLYHKAKRLGIWNPQDIDFSEDIIQWQSFNPTEKEVLLHLSALFQ